MCSLSFSTCGNVHALLAYWCINHLIETLHHTEFLLYNTYPRPIWAQNFCSIWLSGWQPHSRSGALVLMLKLVLTFKTWMCSRLSLYCPRLQSLFQFTTVTDILPQALIHCTDPLNKRDLWQHHYCSLYQCACNFTKDLTTRIANL